MIPHQMATALSSSVRWLTDSASEAIVVLQRMTRIAGANAATRSTGSTNPSSAAVPSVDEATVCSFSRQLLASGPSVAVEGLEPSSGTARNGTGSPGWGGLVPSLEGVRDTSV